MAYGYVIAQIELMDPEGFQAYRAGLPASIAAFGGEFLTKPGRVDTVEGKAPGARAAIIRFPSYEDAEAWYHSDTYTDLRGLRAGKANCTLTLVEGR